MKKLLRKILMPVGVVWFIGLFIVGFLAYFCVSSGPNGPCDGLGRPLADAPMLMRIFLGQEIMWAGWFWFAGDMVIFWGSIAIAISLAKWLED